MGHPSFVEEYVSSYQGEVLEQIHQIVQTQPHAAYIYCFHPQHVLIHSLIFLSSYIPVEEAIL